MTSGFTFAVVPWVTRQISRELGLPADTDTLTGLLDRRARFRELGVVAGRARRSGGAPSVLAIDIDGLKAVNDSHGHAVGDEVIRAVSAAISRRWRADDRCDRSGGDEFMVVASETDADGVRALPERLRRCVAENAVDREGARITVSAAVVTCTTQAKAMSSLSSRARTRPGTRRWAGARSGPDRE